MGSSGHRCLGKRPPGFNPHRGIHTGPETRQIIGEGRRAGDSRWWTTLSLPSPQWAVSPSQNTPEV